MNRHHLIKLIPVLILCTCTPSPDIPSEAFEGLVLQVALSLEESEVTDDEVRQHCRQELTKRGITIIDDLSAEEAWRNRVPLLVIHLEGGEDTETPYSHKKRFAFDYWDTVILKRNPAWEDYVKIVSVEVTAYYKAEVYQKSTGSWDGIQGQLDSMIERFCSQLQRALEGRSDELPREPA